MPNMHCSLCLYDGPDLAGHMRAEHPIAELMVAVGRMSSKGPPLPEKVIDPGNEPSKAKPHSLPWIMELVRKHNGIDLKASEVMLLMNHIDELEHDKKVLELRAAELQTMLNRANFGRNMGD